MIVIAFQTTAFFFKCGCGSLKFLHPNYLNTRYSTKLRAANLSAWVMVLRILNRSFPLPNSTKAALHESVWRNLVLGLVTGTRFDHIRISAKWISYKCLFCSFKKLWCFSTSTCSSPLILAAPIQLCAFPYISSSSSLQLQMCKLTLDSLTNPLGVQPNRAVDRRCVTFSLFSPALLLFPAALLWSLMRSHFLSCWCCVDPCTCSIVVSDWAC